mgnify:CR=1 FL=1
MSPSTLTEIELKWITRFQAVANECPSYRIGAFVSGGQFIYLYDTNKEDEIKNIHSSNENYGFCHAVDAAHARLGAIELGFQIKGEQKESLTRVLTQNERNELTALLGKALLDLRSKLRGKNSTSETSNESTLALRFTEAFHNLPFLIASDRPVNTYDLVRYIDSYQGDSNGCSALAWNASQILGVVLPDKKPCK